MQKTIVTKPEFKLVGLTAVTKTSNAAEGDPATAQIGTTLQTYFGGGLGGTIARRKKPGVTYCVYTDYESDFTGDYTYFVGEEVEAFEEIPEGLSQLVIPAQTYAKFLVGPGPMPAVCIKAWQEIWQMTPVAFGGGRRYRADFEIYDVRASDPEKAILDIYIGHLYPPFCHPRARA